MTKTYHYKKGTMQLGPYALDKMRGLARQGQIGRSHQISSDEGSTWQTGHAYPEIFATGEDAAGPSTGRSETGDVSGNKSQDTVTSVPAETMWHHTMGSSGQHGPIPESQLRALIELGRVGPQDMLWTEAIGSEWVTVSSVPRFQSLCGPTEGISRTNDAERIRDEGPRRKHRRSRAETGRGRHEEPHTKAFNGAGLSGFICSMVAIVLLALPCLVWVVVAESFFWIFNIVVPFTILAIVGLVLSVIGLSKPPRGMATTGTVLGIVALMLGVMALVGWFMLPYRLAMQRRTEIDSFATDIKLEEKNLTEQLGRYRKVTQEQGEPIEEFRDRASLARRLVGTQLDTLVKAYDGHVSATAKTSEFGEAFLELAKLRKTIDEVGQAAKTVEGIELIELLGSSNADSRAIKVLMDTLKLYERGEITLKQAEAKMTGR